MYCNPVAFHRVSKFSSNSSNSVCKRHVSRDIKNTKTNMKYKILFNTNNKKKFNRKNKWPLKTLLAFHLSFLYRESQST